MRMASGSKQASSLAPLHSSAPAGTRFHVRSFRRFPVQCSVYYSSNEFQGTGIAWNLSLNGWRVDGTHPVEPGMVVTLCVFLPGQHPTVFIDRATVCWSRGQEFGIAVSSIKAEEHARLEQFVTALI
ncbi:MAG: PilZ domain-containing protein [Nitrospira sp.]